MRDLYLPTQVQAMDQRAYARGVQPAALMDLAASFLARGVLTVATRRAGLRVVLLCGKGNNGGDGIAAARHLASKDVDALVVLVTDTEELGEDAQRELGSWTELGGQFVVARDERALLDALSGGDVAVDCLLGTGSTGEPRGVYGTAVAVLNRFVGPVVACDIPTGVDGATGAASGRAVRADLTVTLGAHKRGLSLSPGRELAGRVVLGDLDVIDDVAEPVAGVLDPDDLSALVPNAEEAADKRSVGTVLIYAGAEGTSGAAVLCARAALRAGAGLVTVAAPRSVTPIVAGSVPEAMTVGLPDDHHGIVSIISDMMERTDVLAIGPGLGLAEQTQRAVRRLVASIQAPIVLDADGLNAFRDVPEELSAAATELLVATPHAREFARLARLDPDVVDAGRADLAPEWASAWGATVVAKGPATVTASPIGEVWINPTGGPALATGGSGDALTGITAALLAQVPASSTAAVAVYLHGLSGDLAGAAVGVRATTASTVIDHLGPAALAVGL